MYLNEFDESFDYQTAELVFVYIKQLKTWKNQCVSLHPNVDCVLAVNVDDEIPCVNVFEKNEFDLFQKHNLNVKVFVGENGTGKTTLLDSLRKGMDGVTVVLRDSLGRYISSDEITLIIHRDELCESTVNLKKNVWGPIEHLSDCSMLTPLADRDSKNRIREEPFFFYIRFFQIYQKNPHLYQFEKDDELMPYFYIKPRPGFVSNIKFCIEELPGVDFFNEALFEDEFKNDPVSFILLYSFLEQKSFFNDFETSSTIVYPADVLTYFRSKFELLTSSWNEKLRSELNEISESIEKFLIEKDSLTGEKRLKRYETSFFANVNADWINVLRSLSGLLKKTFKYSPSLDFYYYEGFALINGTERYLSDLSDGEISSLKQRYIWYAALTQVSESSGYYLTMDEPDESLHPEWKRLFWKKFVENFEFVKDYVMQEFRVIASIRQEEKESYLEKINTVATRRFGLIISTHSPFLLSDLFAHNVIYLDKEKNGGEWSTSVKKSPKTFAGNIGEMFYSSFFMESTIGAVAEEYVTRILNIRKGINPDNPDEMLSDDQLQEYQREADAICQNISDPVIRCLLE